MPRQVDADKLSYSTETRSVLASTITNPPYYHASFADRGVAGYVHGGTGQNSEVAARTTKLPFSTDTFSLVGLRNIGAIEAKTNNASYDKTFALLAGGDGWGRPDSISIFTYSTETESFLTVTLSEGRRDCVTLDDSGAY
jgi:hypothetical protein